MPLCSGIFESQQCVAKGGTVQNYKSFLIIIQHMILITILAVLCAMAVPNRVIEITTANVQLVLKTVDHLHLLLHNPACQHSKEYAQKFLEVETPLSLGITDCQRQSVLCSHLNISHYPTLVGLTNTSVSILDEQAFLEKEGLASEKDPKVMVNKIVKRLRSESGYVAVVLEQEGLPVLERVSQSSQKGVFYVEPPSALFSSLQATVGRKRGCWILQYKEGHLNRYYCGSGYRSSEVEKYLQNYSAQRLVRHVFTRQTNQSYLQQAELAQIIRQNYALKKCKLVYFHSKDCQHCSLRDTATIDSLMDQFKLKAKYTLQVYDLDHEELPANFTLRRIPQLVEFCNFQMTPFGQVFTVEELTKFLTQDRGVPKVMDRPPEKVVVVDIEAGESVAEERLEL